MCFMFIAANLKPLTFTFFSFQHNSSTVLLSSHMLCDLTPPHHTQLFPIWSLENFKSEEQASMSFWNNVILRQNIICTKIICHSWRIKDQLDVTCYFISLLMCSTCFGHWYIHHQELATILLNYHIGRIVLGSMCVGVSVWLGWSGICVVLQSATQIQLQPNHTKTATHIKPRTKRPMW